MLAEHPRGWQCGVGAPHLGSLLLKFLNGPFVDAPAFVDEVPGGGGFPRVHMADDHDVDVRLLLPHAAGLTGLAGAGGAGEGAGNAAAFWGWLRGIEQGVSKTAPLVPALLPTLSFPRPTFPLDHAAGGARPVWQLCPSWVTASQPPEEASRAISGCHVQPPRLSEMPCFSASCPPPPSRRPPFPRATSWMLPRCPSSLENLPAAFSLFPNPRASPPCRGCPGRSRECPHHSPAGHGPGDNRVSAKWGGQK